MTLTPGKLILAKDYNTIDPNFDNVSLLLSGEGANGSTTIIDSSNNNNVVTAFGDASISTAVETPFSPTVPSDGVLAFDGTGDYLRVPESNSDLTFGIGDFTLEFFIYWNTITASVLLDWRDGIGVQGDRITFYIPSNQLVLFGIYPTGNTLSLNFTPSINTWYHCALSRTGGTLRFFVDGIQTYSGSNPNNYLGPQSSSGIYIGGITPLITGFDVDGYISNLRITKGVARYTANFTPPTQPFFPGGAN